MKRIHLALVALVLVSLACGQSSDLPASPQHSVFDEGRTAYGFFPSPPQVSILSVFDTFKAIGEHGDFVLIQQNCAWQDFVTSVDGKSQTRTDLVNQVKLSGQNGLDTVFVLDALNGLNRREFAGLPAGWEASFANPDVRSAYQNYALWIVRTFQPRYLGLASEINTYMDAYPGDAPNFISLYKEIYALVKAEAPQTQVFVTFQWDDLNNMFPQPEEGNREPYDTNWEQVEAFEPNLDVWVISTYPYFVFNGKDIPADYYSPLLSRTDKPLAVAEGGFTTQAVMGVTGSDEGQVAYLNAIHEQLGKRLVFWVNTILSDLDIDSYAKQMKKNGVPVQDTQTLGAFAYIGLRNVNGDPKPSLEVWDQFRAGR